MKRVLLLVFLCTKLCLSAASSADAVAAIVEVDPFRARANELLPVRATFYEYSEVWKVLSPHLIDKEYFEYALQMMFNKFPAPPHLPAMITGGWQCLLGKVLKAKEGVADQQMALLTLLGLHKSVLEKLAPTLGARAEALLKEVQSAVPCAACLGVARAVYTSSE